MKSLNINTILLVAIAVMATWMVKGCLTKSPPNEKAIRLEEQVKHKEEIRLKDSVYYSGLLQNKDSVIMALMSRSVEKQVQYVQLKTDYGKIRPTVESYNGSELLKRANGFVLE